MMKKMDHQWARGCLQTILFILLLLLFSNGVGSAEAADVNYDPPDENTLIASLTASFNNIIDGTEVGELTSKVYYNGSIYTYILEVTPFFTSRPEFNMGLSDGDSAIGGVYSNYGYDFDQAIIAMTNSSDGSHPSGDGDDIFIGTIDPDNTIDWNVTTDYLSSSYYWASGATITFFFESSSGPVDGFYNLSAGLNSATAAGFVPAPVPGTLLLFGSGIITSALFRRKRSKG